MIENLRLVFIQIFIGFGSGLMVGSGYVAFLTVLGIIPRLVQLSKSYTYLHYYQWCVILGALIGTFFTFTTMTFRFPLIITSIWGLFQGVFVGMLAAGLTEALNVFPILMKRLGIDKELLWLLMAIVLGKVIGSTFQWVIFVDYMP